MQSIHHIALSAVALVILFACLETEVAAVEQNEIVCPPMPDKSTLTGTNINSEITASAGVLSKIKAAELTVKTQTVTKSLLDRFPDAGKLAVLQTLSSTYCSMLKSEAIPADEKVKRWETFQSPILKAEFP
jgi:hypothetical protein